MKTLGDPQSVSERDACASSKKIRRKYSEEIKLLLRYLLVTNHTQKSVFHLFSHWLPERCFRSLIQKYKYVLGKVLSSTQDVL